MTSLTKKLIWYEMEEFHTGATDETANTDDQNMWNNLGCKKSFKIVVTGLYIYVATLKLGTCVSAALPFHHLDEIPSYDAL